jgi:chromosome segregation ATPase
MLTQKEIDEKEKFIKDTQKEIDEFVKQHDEARKNIADAQAKINKCNESIENEQKKIAQFQAEQRQIKTKHDPLPPQIKQMREILEKDAFDKKVQGYVDEAIGFYDCLKDRLKRKQEEYKATMDDYFTFVEPEKVVASIKADIENNRGFSMSHVNIRSAKGQFDMITRELCTIKAQGQKPNIHTAKKQMAQLDAFLESQDVIHRWHKEK